jgi:hypothetical protein
MFYAVIAFIPAVIAVILHTWPNHTRRAVARRGGVCARRGHGTDRPRFTVIGRR